jgi:hypothetical protein
VEVKIELGVESFLFCIAFIFSGRDLTYNKVVREKKGAETKLLLHQKHAI